jgi:hypothetical protein
VSAAERLDREERLDPDACRALAAAVIRQGLRDLAEETDLRHVGTAVAFFASPASSLPFWCLGTEAHEELIRRRAREILELRFGDGEAEIIWRFAESGEADLLELALADEPEE